MEGETVGSDTVALGLDLSVEGPSSAGPGPASASAQPIPLKGKPLLTRSTGSSGSGPVGAGGVAGTAAPRVVSAVHATSVGEEKGVPSPTFIVPRGLSTVGGTPSARGAFSAATGAAAAESAQKLAAEDGDASSTSEPRSVSRSTGADGGAPVAAVEVGSVGAPAPQVSTPTPSHEEKLGGAAGSGGGSGSGSGSTETLPADSAAATPAPSTASVPTPAAPGPGATPAAPAPVSKTLAPAPLVLPSDPSHSAGTTPSVHSDLRDRIEGVLQACDTSSTQDVADLLTPTIVLPPAGPSTVRRGVSAASSGETLQPQSPRHHSGSVGSGGVASTGPSPGPGQAAPATSGE